MALLVRPAPAAETGTVVLDPGHGGYEFGINNKNIKEKDVTLAVAKLMAALLVEDGRKVVLTRKIDRHMTNAERQAMIEKSAPDVLISLHLSDSESIMVYVSWYKKTEADLSLAQFYSMSSMQRRYLYESKALASLVGETLGTELGISIFQGELPLQVLNTTAAPAILVELPSKGIEYNKLNIMRLAYSLAIGIQLYEEK